MLRVDVWFLKTNKKLPTFRRMHLSRSKADTVLVKTIQLYILNILKNYEIMSELSSQKQVG